MFLFNLLFDPNDLSGQFVKTQDCENPLKQSRVWLELEGPDPGDPRDFNPEAEGIVWNSLGAGAAIVISKGNASPFIAMRIAPMTPVDPNAVLHAFVTFGREPRAPQHFASPFTRDDIPRSPVKAVFNFEDSPTIRGENGWFFPLKPITLAPERRGVVHSYEFTVGAIYQGGAATYVYDPQMDVTV
jgi:hypothetical protein